MSIVKNACVSLLTSLAAATALVSPLCAQQQQKPNILVIMGDDIGYWNISAYNRGMMGYRTPNIDRIANEGAIFTDYYGQQSCTAGRAAFITGQSPLRTGLLKVGLPGAKEGLSGQDPTIADLLKPQGYATGQFGKNHLGDRNEFLPTVHGFDEFFGNLYHLNAEDEPEHPDYPKNPAFRAQFGPRGVMKCFATTVDTPGDDPRFGPWGKQKCEDTGPLTKKRMETIDEEFLGASVDFIERANRDKKPFFVWFNPSRMHIWTRLKAESQGKTGLGIYPDGMVEHDGQVGQILKKLDDLGIANNTIVIYTTDNGAEAFSWPDGGTTPFKGEKNTNWEGGYRVPAMVRWPGLVPARTEINDVFSAEDWATTLVAAAGEPDIKTKLLVGYDAGGKNFKVLAQTTPSTPQHEPLQKTIGQATPEIVPSLIVMNARGASLQGGKLTLTGVAPNSIVFADRPVRAAGHSLTTDLLHEWSPSNDSADSFNKDPPNATVSVFSTDGSKVRDAVVVLKTAKLESDRLTFDVDVLEGDLAGGDGPAALFIDRFGGAIGCGIALFYGGKHGADRAFPYQPSRPALDHRHASGPFHAADRPSVGADHNFGRRTALVERRTGKTGNPRFRPRHHGTGQPEICAP
jgi:arylsulfatase